MLRHSRGQYTEDHINRCAKMGGTFGKNVDRLFDAAICDMTETYSKTSSSRYASDLETFVENAQKEALFDYCPPRKQTGMNCFIDRSHRIKKPEKLGAKLREIFEDHQFWRERSEYSKSVAVGSNRLSAAL